ncbi:NAD(P)-binding protein [Microthyrium microscopicum]|uniref:NAD(P)-binding protein n=1 Tax=Microthyrium microscopicum TaxID=703497 RepID=A0A6A6UNF0_9PEZI|nr:NAD(P)-binding protein [Microthyrium microscopicum]
MAQVVKKKLVVCGGNGFLGSRICKAAVGRGWDVTSISRSGEPKWSTVTSSPEKPSWSQQVKWQKANILQPATYISDLDGADAVVHSMGILLEADYKGVLQGKESIWSGLSRAFGAKQGADTNPLEQEEGTPAEPKEHDGQLTYELMNRDSAILLAREAVSKSVPAYVYISAAEGAPVLPARYITTKRAAESTISSAFPKLRSVFIRAPFMYDSSRTFTMPLAAATSVAAAINSAVGGRLTPLMGAGGTKPLKADDVADAVVEAVEDEGRKGAIGVSEIQELAIKAWRRNMS